MWTGLTPELISTNMDTPEATIKGDWTRNKKKTQKK